MPIAKEVLSALRSALAHLDDPIYLENHPLAGRIRFIAEAAPSSRGKILRRALRLAIEALDPHPNGDESGAQLQCYQVLYRYAIAKQSILAIAAQLNISERQAYRELERSVEALAAVLFPEETAFEPSVAPAVLDMQTSLRSEVERLSVAEKQRLDLAALVTDVVESARYLAESRGIEIILCCPSGEMAVFAHRVMLRQVLLNLLSHAVVQHQGARIGVKLESLEGTALVHITYLTSNPGVQAGPETPLAVAAQLAETLGVIWSKQRDADGTTRISLRIPLLRERVILIVDDNEGLIALFRRYLAHQPYRVYAACSASQALRAVDQIRPDVIILDVMMPEQDGWEALMSLRANPAGRAARVVVCSIINDPQLSAALGADGFLHKPVDRASLLQLLDRVVASR